ncbi:MAG TPA: prepilin-type N-terminal cleavage/methylation domain-containing protein [Verrucomicrobiae bacterium]|nr:prepilin-type N-terminal cleavage/methylation domain-containing protein [Verrucomicrobiae bacterium]
MQKQLQRKSQSGFTIIEVMIVLAIAALILLIVLLAVPALQRNSRNTTIKNDASSLAGAISTFESDNNGTAPTSVTGTGSISLTASGATSETATLNGSTVVSLLGAPLSGETDLASGSTLGEVITSANGQTSTIYVQVDHACPPNDGSTSVAHAPASTRSLALYYLIETSSGNTLQCVSA